MESRVSLTKFSTLAGIVTAVAGHLVLIYWQLEILILKPFLPDAFIMNTKTAAAFFLINKLERCPDI